MTPQMMVLGATIAGPGTIAEIQKRLVELWPAADFDGNASHTNLPLLADKELVDVVERGERKVENRYAINDKGWAHIREWVARWPPDPALREPIPAKTRLARLEDLPFLIEMARAQAERCGGASDSAQGKLVSEERLLEKRPPRNADEEFSVAIRVAQGKLESLGWGDLQAQYENYADDVERIFKRFSKGERPDDEEI
jgi:DNA-binding PadR family transcriptional regulator